MDFEQVRKKLIAKGYTTDTANAKIAHDVVLDAVRDARRNRAASRQQQGADIRREAEELAAIWICFYAIQRRLRHVLSFQADSEDGSANLYETLHLR